jgi:hypothetical protein
VLGDCDKEEEEEENDDDCTNTFQCVYLIISSLARE